MGQPKHNALLTLTLPRSAASAMKTHRKSQGTWDAHGSFTHHGKASAQSKSELPKVSAAAAEFSRQAQLVLSGKADLSTLVVSEALLKERAAMMANMRPLAELDVDAFAEAMTDCDW